MKVGIGDSRFEWCSTEAGTIHIVTRIRKAVAWAYGIWFAVILGAGVQLLADLFGREKVLPEYVVLGVFGFVLMVSFPTILLLNELWLRGRILISRSGVSIRRVLWRRVFAASDLEGVEMDPYVSDSLSSAEGCRLVARTKGSRTIELVDLRTGVGCDQLRSIAAASDRLLGNAGAEQES